MSPEGYIKALVKGDPIALIQQDEQTGLCAFQVAALRTGDLDSGYNLLRMAPHMLHGTNPSQSKTNISEDVKVMSSCFWCGAGESFASCT